MSETVEDIIVKSAREQIARELGISPGVNIESPAYDDAERLEWHLAGTAGMSARRMMPSDELIKDEVGNAVQMLQRDNEIELAKLTRQVAHGIRRVVRRLRSPTDEVDNA